MTQAKRCSRCKEVLPLSCFGKHSRRKDGLRGECKPCEAKRAQGYILDGRAAQRAAAYRQRHPEKVQVLTQRRNARVRTKRAAERGAKRAAWLAEPAPTSMTCTRCGTTKPIKMFGIDRRARWGHMRTCKRCKSLATRSYVNATPERHAAVVARASAWNAEHPDAMKERVRRRRARLRQATVLPFTIQQLEARMSMFGYRCWMCGGPYEQVDHVKPVSKGGAHMLCNLRPACGRCNLAKNGRWPLHAIPMLTAKAMEGLVPETVYDTLQNESVTGPAR